MRQQLLPCNRGVAIPEVLPHRNITIRDRKVVYVRYTWFVTKRKSVAQPKWLIELAGETIVFTYSKTHNPYTMQPLTLSDAEQRLKAARQRAKALQAEIVMLKQAIVALGGDLHPNRTSILERNKSIYKRWADGESFKELAHDHRLSITRVRSICSRIDLILEKKVLDRFPQYMDLVPYKK